MLDKKLVLVLMALLFGTIILLGEGFKISFGLVKVSLPLIIVGFILMSSINRSLRIYTSALDKGVYLYCFLFIPYTVIGMASGNAFRDILEDLYPVLVFGALYIVMRSWDIADINDLWYAIILFGTLAAIKVMVIGMLPYEILWSNNWQAAKEPLPLNGFSRIILRGGDIFISFALVYYLIEVHRKVWVNMPVKLFLVILTLVAVFISLSRSSFLADGIAIALVFLLFRNRFATRKLFTFSSILLVVLIALLPFINTISLAASIFEARTDAFDADDVSVTFRANEQNLIFEKAASVFYMGNGLGSYFYMPYSGSEKKDGRSIYAHNYINWILLKIGIPGVLLFFFIFLRTCYFYIFAIRNSPVGNEYDMLALSLLAAGIVVMSISFLANKLSTLSGSVFFALFTSSAQILSSRYDRRH